MIWNVPLRKEAETLHAHGWTDRQMADHFGVSRAQMASYRANCMKLPANYGRRTPAVPMTCEQCGKRYSKSRLRRHMINDHHAAPKKRGPMSRKERVYSVLHGRNGYFDSAKLLDILTTRRDAA